MAKPGVKVNLVATDVSNFMGLVGVTVPGHSAIDTFGQIDTFNLNSSSQTAIRAFNLTDAQDYLLGGALSIDVYGGNGDDFITGGDGNDSLNGGDDDDTIKGGAGDDYIMGERGDDHLYGGANTKPRRLLSYEWEEGPSGIDVLWDQLGSNNQGVVRDTYGDHDDFYEFEVIKGTDQRDMFVGNDGDNQVEGNGGFDIFAGGGRQRHLQLRE